MTKEETPELASSSASMAEGFGAIGEVIFLVIWVAVIATLIFTVRSSSHFDKLAQTFEVAALSLFYAVHGLAAVTAAGILVAPAYLVATADPSLQARIGRYALYAAGGYVALAVLGYVVRHTVVEPARSNYEAWREDTEQPDGGEPA